jgi:hypothetical protein
VKKLRVIFFLAVFVFTCSVSVGAEDFNKNWLGTWLRESDRFNKATMEISYNTENSFSFKIQALCGVHTGAVLGVALIKDNFAVFDDGKDGILGFSLENNKIILKQNSGMARYGGIGVGFGGNYVQGDINLKDVTFIDHKILTPYQEELFKEMTGQYYETFKNTLHIRYEVDDLDGFGSKVHRVGVRGLFSYMECIVMVTDDNKIWAAVIDGNNIRYFTNTTQTQLPLTIEKWRERFKYRLVIYQS